MKRTKKLVATVGEYTDPATGEKKKRRETIGSVFTDANGRESLKINTFPVGRYWDGWISIYDLDPPRQQASPHQTMQSYQTPPHGHPPQPAQHTPIREVVSNRWNNGHPPQPAQPAPRQPAYQNALPPTHTPASSSAQNQ